MVDPGAEQHDFAVVLDDLLAFEVEGDVADQKHAGEGVDDVVVMLIGKLIVAVAELILVVLAILVGEREGGGFLGGGLGFGRDFRFGGRHLLGGGD